MKKEMHISTSIGDHYIENDILHIRFNEDADIDVEELLESKRARLALQENRPMKVFVDVRRILSISKEAREIAAKDEHAAMSIAMAIITDSLGTRILTNFFIKFNKPASPTKMFKNEASALAWLENFR